MSADKFGDESYLDSVGGVSNKVSMSHRSAQASCDNSDDTSAMQTTPNVLAGFLFGNIDDNGDLQDDFFDQDTRRCLRCLTGMDGIGTVLKEITDVEEDAKSSYEDVISDYSVKCASAVDYSDIAEAVEEEEKDEQSCTLDGNMDGETPDSDRTLMPPPVWLPTPSMIAAQEQVTQQSSPSRCVVSLAGGSDGDISMPLANMLPPELKDVDVTSCFPDFRRAKVLRFSRLFKPAYVPHIYKKRRKRRDDRSDGDGNCKADSLEAMSLTEYKDDSVADSERLADDYFTEQELSERFKLDFGRPAMVEEVDIDDEAIFSRPVEHKYLTSIGEGEAVSEQQGATVAPWRYGPAQYWYDMIGVSETGENFDYGFKLKKEAAVGNDGDRGMQGHSVSASSADSDIDPFLMVTQQHWEDDVIWNRDDVRQKVLQNHRRRAEYAGWVPSAHSRYAAQFLQQVHNQFSASRYGPNFAKMLSGQGHDGKEAEWYSIFPIENEELLYDRWEDDIIWDPNNMDFIPTPHILTLDPNDENLILEIPKDIDLTEESAEPLGKKEKEVRKSRILLGKAGVIKDDEEDKDEVSRAVQFKDHFNLSNDEHYIPKVMDSALRPNIGSSLIQHSTPAMELRLPFFPTHLGANKLRSFHRAPLKRYSHGTLSVKGPHPVHPLLKTIKRKAKLREQERQVFGGGEIFFMRTPQDLSSMDGEIILAEFTEEFPPLLNQIGMCSKIKNYYKRKPGKDSSPPAFEYGELAYAHTSPFLGMLRPGQSVQGIENNMFRSPIFRHTVPSTDFVIIRTRNNYYIRDVSTIYTVGQECPLYEVPGPNSKRANNFVRDFLQVFIYRLFWKSKDRPRRIRMEDVKKAFPSHSESSIRKRLKLCADFKRTGMDSNWWVVKQEFRLPNEEEIRSMVSPEQCCAWYSMVTAEQRLKDAGYGEKSLFAPEEENEEDTQIKIEDEVRAAPWSTTRSYIAAMKGKCLLQLHGVAEPTGCGEGFSYIKVPNKPTLKEDCRETPMKKMVTGTDADLRRLVLRDARQMLRSRFGLKESDITKLSRWEVIDVVRTMSTAQVKQGQGMSGVLKFARGNRYSTAEHLERYKDDCQRIFELQNRVLGSEEVLSTDEESSSGEDSEFEEMGKNIESLLSNKKTSSQLSMEKEEEERLELRKMLLGTSCDKEKDRRKGVDKDISLNLEGKKLKITRTFQDEHGKQYIRVETVSNSAVIKGYVHIRQTKDAEVIKRFGLLEDEEKEEMRKERRRLQEQLRRIKRNEGKPCSDSFLLPPKKLKKKKETPSLLKMKCGACGGHGHMRTNKECPMYNKGLLNSDPVQVAMTEEQVEEEEKNLPIADEELINVEGTKMIVSKAVFDRAEDIRRRSMLLRIPKLAVEAKKKKRRDATDTSCDYLKKPKQSSNRRRTDPVVTMSSMFEVILNEMRQLSGTQPFLFPVNQKEVPDYYKIITRPMDLQTMRENVRSKQYQSREAFLNDANQIVENSRLYNGAPHILTLNAQSMLEQCLRRFAEREQKFMRLEKAINPLLDDDDQVALSYIILSVIKRMVTIENCWPFMQPVNKKMVKDYYNLIQRPMDLSTVQKNAESHRYHSRDDFLEDVELIYTNCLSYNGPDSSITATARRLMETCKDGLIEHEDTLSQLEVDVRAVQEAALDAAESDSIFTGGDNDSLDSFALQENVATVDDDYIDYFSSSLANQDVEYDDECGEDVLDVGQELVAGRTVAEYVDEGMLDSYSGEDEEMVGEGVNVESMEPSATPRYFDEATQGFGPADEADVGYIASTTGDVGALDDEEDDASFDPAEFFKNSALASAVGERASNVHDDLQVSDSDDEDERDPSMLIPSKDQHEEGFDIDEYF